MSEQPPVPIYTLRGHEASVTALVTYETEDQGTRLVSGDENGTVIIWNLATYRPIQKFARLTNGRIQCLKTLFNDDYLFIHSRQQDNGVSIVNIEDLCDTKLSFNSCDAVFSRADALDFDAKRSITAFPSSLGQHIVEVRVIDSSIDYATFIAGTASKDADNPDKNTCSAFDICLRKMPVDNAVLMFVGYEDGTISVYCLKLDDKDSEKTMPALGATGLRLRLIKTYDMQQKDFVSAFDVALISDDKYKLICGFPFSEVYIINDTYQMTPKETDKIEQETRSIRLKTNGVSTIKIRPDKRIVIIGTWNSNIKVFSAKGKPLASLNYHQKRVSDLAFVDCQKKNNCLLLSKGDAKFVMACASADATISLSTIY